MRLVPDISAPAAGSLLSPFSLGCCEHSGRRANDMIPATAFPAQEEALVESGLGLGEERRGEVSTL